MAARSITRRAILSHIDPAYRQLIGHHNGHDVAPVQEHGDQTHLYAVSLPAATLITMNLRSAGYRVTTGLWPTTLYVTLPA